MVYFIATKLFREQKGGTTLLISPLLSLMRNQLEVAKLIGLEARSLNSTNPSEWPQITTDLKINAVDILVISPERLGNAEFINEILPILKIGLLVIDEAHCISDWGHDFRPDYRRIGRLIQALPPNIPVLATTATANDRVIEDIKAQLGRDLTVLRGSLARSSLKLQNIYMPDAAIRLAWLAKTIPTLVGSGIIYTLTKRDAEQVAEWLRSYMIDAHAYHADIDSDNVVLKETLELQLMNNEIKVLVATVALGMGFDKPDLSFVIHYQRPSSVVHYYQQVGRAGRALTEAFGILLHGEEDDHIAQYFIASAFPSQKHVDAILRSLQFHAHGLTQNRFHAVVNLSKSQIEKTLKFLQAESPSPIIYHEKCYKLTASASNYLINQENINLITKIRQEEQHQMNNYMSQKHCLMVFLQKQLDDPSSTECGKCKNCFPQGSLDESYDHETVINAQLFLKRCYQPIHPRKQWPVKDMFEHQMLSSFKIPPELQAQEGRALCLWRDAGWGEQVASGKKSLHFDNALVEACACLLRIWNPTPTPSWITFIPSKNRPSLVQDFANRLGQALCLQVVDCIEILRRHKEQKAMLNSYQQAKNLDGVFKITNQCQNYPCLLVDDVVSSGWTFTVAAALLRQAGCPSVFPLALALNSQRMD